MAIYRSNNVDEILTKVSINKKSRYQNVKKEIAEKLQKEINKLKAERAKRKELSDKRSIKIKKICRTIQLRLEGNTLESVAATMGISRKTVSNYMKSYNNNHNFMLEIPKHNTSELEPYEFLIEDLFIRKHIKNYSEAQREVEKEIIRVLERKGLDGDELEQEINKIKISHTQFKNFLKRHDFKLNYRGYLYHYQTSNVKARRKEILKVPADNTSKESNDSKILVFLENNLKEIESYIRTFPSYYREEKILDEVIKHFQLQRYQRNIIKNYLINNSSYF